MEPVLVLLAAGMLHPAGNAPIHAVRSCNPPNDSMLRVRSASNFHWRSTSVSSCCFAIEVSIPDIVAEGLSPCLAYK